jgi:cystathionine gamma-synthase
LHKLARICETKFGLIGEQCLLFATASGANICRSFIADQSARHNVKVSVRIARNDWQDKDKSVRFPNDMQLHIVLFPSEATKYGRLFWQHTGMGISSRFAECWLSILAEGPAPHALPTSAWSRLSNKAPNKYYTARASPLPLPDDLSTDQSVYLEERYGRNLPQESAASAKRALRRRIANVLIHDTQDQYDSALREDVELGPSSRGVAEVTEHDVFLYPCGMTSIWNAHQLALATRPSAKSVGFG